MHFELFICMLLKSVLFLTGTTRNSNYKYLRHT